MRAIVVLVAFTALVGCADIDCRCTKQRMRSVKVRDPVGKMKSVAIGAQVCAALCRAKSMDELAGIELN